MRLFVFPPVTLTSTALRRAKQYNNNNYNNNYNNNIINNVAVLQVSLRQKQECNDPHAAATEHRLQQLHTHILPRSRTTRLSLTRPRRCP